MKRVLIISLCVSFGLYLILLGLVVSKVSFIINFDARVSELISAARPESIISLMQAITRLGNGVIPTVLTVIACLILVLKNKLKDTLFFSGTMLSGLLLKSLNKILVDRLRPLDGIIAVTESSFPSGHAMLSLLFFSLAAFYIHPLCKSKREQHLLSWAVAVIVLLIGFSRIYLGVHWFTDVLGGYLLGIAWLSLALLAYKRL